MILRAALYSAAYSISGLLLAAALSSCGAKPNGAAHTENLSENLTAFTDYKIMSSRALMDNQEASLTLGPLAQALLEYDVIFIGEAHGHIGNHIAQAEILAALHALYPNLALSMEQFDRPQQSVLNSYLASEIGENTLIYEGGAWEGYTQSYRPLVEFAKAHKLPVIAANVPTSIVRCIRERGAGFIGALPSPDKDWVAQTLDLADGAYKDKFYGFLGGHSGGAGHHGQALSEDDKAKSYAAQIARDQTMAQSIARHLTANPMRKIVHINGSFHSEGGLGTPENLTRYVPSVRAVNIHPVFIPALTSGSELMALAQDAASSGTYLLALQETPDQFVQMDKINAYIRRAAAQQDETACTY